MMRKKTCFGILDRVFPEGQGGIREVPPECLDCPDRVQCLKAALNTEKGLELRAEVLERASGRGFLGSLRRWSHKKTLSRLLKQAKEKRP